MRLSRVALTLGALILPLVGAYAAGVELEGKLLNAPIPLSYNLTGGDLYFHQGKPYVEVRGEGDCHYEWHQECYFQGNPPQYVCHQVPQWVCVQDRAQFLLPGSVTLANKDVFYAGANGNVRIGVVKSFLFWTWIKLGDNAKLAVSHNRAVLRIDLGNGAPRTDRQEVFASLYSEPAVKLPSVDLMVKFQNVSNVEARQLLVKAGYEGELAGSNDWSERDMTRDEIGVRLPVRQAAALIAKLKQSSRVLGVRPAGTSASE